MKILHVLPSLDPREGGVCQALKTMILGLSEHDTHNEVLCLDYADADYLNGLGFTVHALGRGKGPYRYNKRVIPWLRSNLTFFDAVIVHGLWSYVGYAVRKTFDRLNKQSLGIAMPGLFVMPHGMLDPYFQRVRKRWLKSIRNSVFWTVVERKLISRADSLLFTCEDEMMLASETFSDYKPKATDVVGLGIDQAPLYTVTMKEALEASCPGLKGNPYLLFMGRIDEKKGVDILVQAYLEVLLEIERDKSNIPVAGLLPKLVIAGPGMDTPYGRKIKKFVTAHGPLRNSVVFPGMLTGDAKWGALYGCEAFILPSHQENFGVAVVEALSCAKPVLISTQVNIWREINESGGCYVASDTLAGTKKLLEFWEQSSYKQRNAMSRNASHAFKKYFSLQPAAVRLLKALKESRLIKSKI